MEEQSSGTGSRELKRRRSEAQEPPSHMEVQRPSAQSGEVTAQGSTAALTNGTSMVNGDAHLPNGVNHNAHDDGPPPPLDQSWREEGANVSLGKMLERLAQFCMTDLTALVDELEEMPVQPSAIPINGMTVVEDTDEVSLTKKRKIMDFAREQRDRFIRALVISDFSRNADDVANVIDVNLHLRKNDFAVAESIKSIGQLKLDSAQAKQPNPNIELAMELLSTGKTLSAPEYGYLPPPKITAKDLLKTLREMNVMLAARLNLHEDVPTVFESYSIANGRATFVVPAEFEVDLAVIDEELTSSFFFIDIRFLFTPSADAMDGGLREHFEVEVNRAIRDKGLQGCYDTLHNFVLTHKINILHQQAGELHRGRWYETIKVDRMRRNLVVQYWTGRPGKKHWLEFGIASGASKGKAVRMPASPVITVRWFQSGVEVEGTGLDIDWQQICLEDILLQATAKHALAMLTAARNGFQTLTSGLLSMSMSVDVADDSAAEHILALGFPPLRRELKLSILPIDGQYSIAPPSTAAAHAQQRLNEEPTIDVPRRLASTLSAVTFETVHREATNLKWTQVTDLARQTNLNALFGSDHWQWRAYVPNTSWGTDWAIALTVSPAGLKWWTVQLQAASDGNERTVTMAHEMSMSADTDRVPSRKLLLQVARQAVAQVSFTAISLQLQPMQIPFRLEKQKLMSSDPSSATQRRMVMFIQFSKLVKRSQEKKWKPWALEPVRVTHHGAERKASDDTSTTLRCRHDVRLVLKEGMFTRLRQHLSRSRDRSIKISASGALAIRLSTPLGAPFIDQLQDRLASIYRLDRCVSILHNAQARCDTVSLSALSLTYNSSSHYSAHLAFPSNPTQRTRLRLEPPESNPHARIRIHLENSLSTAHSQPFEQFIALLLLTLPLLTAPCLTSRGVLLQIRSASWYSLKYLAPFPAVTFTLRIRVKPNSSTGSGQELKWHIEQERTKVNAESLPTELIASLRELWKTSDPQVGYSGLGNGLVTDGKGISKALAKIDSVVRGFGGAEMAATVKSEVRTGSAGAPAGGEATVKSEGRDVEVDVIAID
ncbi:hypothetical protein B0A48_03070 [Cryoendolithus antarcticus]|uniref:Mediator of RNA polymerase II transcription subunit 14 n=1 Tax=Cryoendolithus antarcticus TaxID=1507870 RepID=A0A1V8TMG6_9PEZI|nr:hypothetical protein B0A48_03070 [Cryoendolithus antarcticus]